MNDVMLIEDAPAPVEPGRKLKIAFVADQFSPPVFDGSTLVYKSWIDFLAERYALYAILFSSYGGDIDVAQRYLAERCRGHLILPGAPRSRLWKALRAASRFGSGAVFAPRWVEEFGRGAIHRTVADFAQRYDLRLFLISKLATVPLFGESNLRREDATFLLDAHDDFVTREQQERDALIDLFRRFPTLKRYRRFREMRLRQQLSRLVPKRAREQEARLCALFDCVLSSSPQEHAFYQTRLAGIVPSVRLGWPIAKARLRARPAGDGSAEFDAGFIGGDYPFNVAAILYFCTEILPLVQRSRPGFRLLIAGHVSKPLAHLGKSWPGVEVCGYLPDARSFYDRVGMVVVPLLSGTGVSIKTQEALDCGKPVVSTSIGARGLGDEAVHPALFIADRAEAFADKILALCAATEAGACLHRADLVQAAVVAAPPFRTAFEEVLHRYGGIDQRRLTCSE